MLQVPDDEHVLVEGINMVKRHTRPNPQGGKQGGILSKEMPLHVAKVAIWNPGTKKADPSRFQGAGGRQEGAAFQFERRDARRVSAGTFTEPMARLQQFYRETVVPKLKADLQLANPMQVPKITKITVNMGVGEAVADRKVMDAAVGDMTKITGQKPLVTKSRKSIASFKLREGLAIGCKVTLRGRAHVRVPGRG